MNSTNRAKISKRVTPGPGSRPPTAGRRMLMLCLRPEPGPMAAAPLGFQLHALSAWALFAFWPFSRLVHVFSMPLGYLTRPYIVYRSRDTELGARVPRRGWERVR